MELRQLQFMEEPGSSFTGRGRLGNNTEVKIGEYPGDWEWRCIHIRRCKRCLIKQIVML